MRAHFALVSSNCRTSRALTGLSLAAALALGPAATWADDGTRTGSDSASALDIARKGGEARLRFIDLAAFQQAHAEGARVLDANRPRTYAKAHVPGAISVGGGPVTRAQLPEDPDAPVVLYCATVQCPSSRMAARQALALGHRNVQVYKEGLKGWLSAGLPFERGAP